MRSLIRKFRRLKTAPAPSAGLLRCRQQQRACEPPVCRQGAGNTRHGRGVGQQASAAAVWPAAVIAHARCCAAPVGPHVGPEADSQRRYYGSQRSTLHTLRPGCMMHSPGSGGLPASSRRTSGPGVGWGVAGRAGARRVRGPGQRLAPPAVSLARTACPPAPQAALTVLKVGRVEGGLEALHGHAVAVHQELGVAAQARGGEGGRLEVNRGGLVRQGGGGPARAPALGHNRLTVPDRGQHQQRKRAAARTPRPLTSTRCGPARRAAAASSRRRAATPAAAP